MSEQSTLQEQYDFLYLSPHLDDVALSCGGQIYLKSSAGEKVLIVTIAAGEPGHDIRSNIARAHHEKWELDAETAIAARRAEDVAACQRLGADFLHWSLPDCIYRLHPEQGKPLYTTEEAIFGELDSSESALVEDLARQLQELPPARHVIGPLTVGSHVDHYLTRAAAEIVFGRRLLYYEDYPYVQRNPEALAALLTPRSRWTSERIELSPDAVQARLDAIRLYPSQIASLFGDERQLEARLTQHIQQRGGERLWRQTGS